MLRGPGGGPRTGADRFVAPAKPALAPSMAVVARGSEFEVNFSMVRRILVVFNENQGEIGPKSAYPQQAFYSRTGS